MTTSIEKIKELSELINNMLSLNKDQKQYLISEIIEIAELAHDEAYEQGQNNVFEALNG